MSSEDNTTFIELDYNDIDGELAAFTGHLNRTGHRLAEATRDAAIAELNYKKIRARLKLEVRHEAEVKGVKMTDKIMEATVEQLDTYIEAKMAVIYAEEKRDKLKSDVSTLESKGRHLDALGRRLTAEFNSTRFTQAT